MLTTHTLPDLSISRAKCNTLGVTVITHNPPSKKMPISSSFRFIDTCKRHRIGSGRTRIKTSVITLRTEEARSSALRLIHFPLTRGFQSEFIGEHSKISTSTCARLYDRTKPPTHHRRV